MLVLGSVRKLFSQKEFLSLFFLISEQKDEIKVCAKEAETCLQLLLPTPDDFLQNFCGIDNVIDSSVGGSVQAKTSSQEKIHNANGTASPPNTTCVDASEVHDQPEEMVDEDGDPDGNDKDEDNGAMEDDEEEIEDRQLHGLPAADHSIVIDLGQPDTVAIQETSDNADVVRTLKESSKLISTNFLPRVTQWLEVNAKQLK